MLNHQFIQMYNIYAEDEDHIAWLKEYIKERELLKAKNRAIKVDLGQYGLDDLVGLQV